MTRPMQEIRDKAAETHYAVRQLQRRPASGANYPWAYILGSDVAIATGGGNTMVFNQSIGTITGDTSDVDLMEPITTSGTNNGIDFKAPGIYLLDLMLTWVSPQTATHDYRITWSSTTLFPASGLFGFVNEGGRLTNGNGIYNKTHIAFVNDLSGTFKADASQQSGSTQTLDEVLLKVVHLPTSFA